MPDHFHRFVYVFSSFITAPKLESKPSKLEVLVNVNVAASCAQGPQVASCSQGIKREPARYVMVYGTGFTRFVLCFFYFFLDINGAGHVYNRHRSKSEILIFKMYMAHQHMEALFNFVSKSQKELE